VNVGEFLRRSRALRSSKGEQRKLDEVERRRARQVELATMSEADHLREWREEINRRRVKRGEEPVEWA
jgi:hypothetical protein